MPHIVMARCSALPGRETELSERIAELAACVRKEGGNESFEVYAHAEAEGVWTMIESYRDRAAFETHLDQSHTKAFDKALAALAKGGASDVSELAPTCLPDDAAPGIRGIDHVGVTVRPHPL